jgi:hypothetical protein
LFHSFLKLYIGFKPGRILSQEEPPGKRNSAGRWIALPGKKERGKRI